MREYADQNNSDTFYAVTFIIFHLVLNTFHATSFFLYSLETSENLSFSRIFSNVKIFLSSEISLFLYRKCEKSADNCLSQEMTRQQDH